MDDKELLDYKLQRMMIQMIYKSMVLIKWCWSHWKCCYLVKLFGAHAHIMWAYAFGPYSAFLPVSMKYCIEHQEINILVRCFLPIFIVWVGFGGKKGVATEGPRALKFNQKNLPTGSTFLINCTKHLTQITTR